MMERIGLLFHLAARNIRRQARRSLLTAMAMVLGLGLLIFSRTLAEGAHDDWIDSGVRLGSGHLAIQSPGFQESRDIKDRLTADDLDVVDTILASLRSTVSVTLSTRRIEVSGLANSATSALPVVVMGVESETERGFSELDTKLVDGRYLEPDDRLHVFIGAGLAERLGLRIGSRMVLTAEATDGEIAGQFVRVVGTFRTGISATDDGLVHMPLATAQEWLAMDEGISRYVMMVGTSWDVEDAEAALEAAARPYADRVRILSWQEAMPALLAAVQLDDYGDYVFHTILFIIIALAIINTVLMSVLHRVREFGVLRALGLTRRETGTLVFIEGVLLTTVSGLVGLVLGLAVTWIFFRNGLDFSAMWDEEFTFSGVVIETVIVPVFRVPTIVQSLGFIMVIGLLSSLYPSYRATKIDVAEAMKFEA